MKKENVRGKVLNFSAGICFLLSVALFVVLQLLKVESIAQWYSKATDILMKFEAVVEDYGATWLSIIIIELNFLTKAMIPWVPISCICVISGVLFKWPVALAINIVGLIILFTVRYFWGKHLGGGNTEKILAKYEKAYSFIDSNRFGSPAVLFGFRLIPCLPLNSISQLYGSLEFTYWKYLLISLAGFAYKLFSYTIIGRNVYDPLSAKFIVPLVGLFFLSGLALLAINGVFHATKATIRLLNRRKQKNGLPSADSDKPTTEK